MINEIERYNILTSMNTNSLEKQIEAKVSDGWQPYGKLLVSSDGSDVMYVQSIVKYKRLQKKW